MISSSFSPRRITAAFALCAAILGLASVPAHARVFVGVGVGAPFFGYGYYPPPLVYYPPPPVYYAPPPVYYPQPRTYVPAPAAAQACYAGPYTCPMDRPAPPGGSCYCPGNGGQRVWGHAN